MPWYACCATPLMAVCPIVELELPYTARSAAHRDELLDLLGSAFSWVSMPDRVFSRAAEVQAALTRHGQHRSAGTVDRLTGLIGRAGPAVVVDSGRPAA